MRVAVFTTSLDRVNTPNCKFNDVFINDDPCLQKNPPDYREGKIGIALV